MPEDIPKQVSRTVYKPPSREETACRERQERERLRLQGEQDDKDLADGFVGNYRPAQNWTPYYNELQARAAAEGRALGRGHEEDMIARMLNPGGPPAEPGYRPSPEALRMIAHEEAREQVAVEEAESHDPLSLEEREKRIAAREEEIAKREELAVREAELQAREDVLNEREQALQRTSDFRSPEQLDDLDGLRRHSAEARRDTSEDFGSIRPGFSAHQAPPTWAGRKRMTAEERLAAEAAGVELFGDGSENSAWSRLDNMPNPDGLPIHRPRVSNDPAQRINDILASRQASYTEDADGEAQRLADLAAAEDQVAQEDAAGRDAMRKAQEDYDRRQAEAQATIDRFRQERGGMGF